MYDILQNLLKAETPILTVLWGGGMMVITQTFTPPPAASCVWVVRGVEELSVSGSTNHHEDSYQR